LNKTAGTRIFLKARRAAPVLGSRFLRSYVPLRCGPSASVAARDIRAPADVIFIFPPGYFSRPDPGSDLLYDSPPCSPHTSRTYTGNQTGGLHTAWRWRPPRSSVLPCGNGAPPVLRQLLLRPVLRTARIRHRARIPSHAG